MVKMKSSTGKYWYCNFNMDKWIIMCPTIINAVVEYFKKCFVNQLTFSIMTSLFALWFVYGLVGLSLQSSG